MLPARFSTPVWPLTKPFQLRRKVPPSASVPRATVFKRMLGAPPPPGDRISLKKEADPFTGSACSISARVITPSAAISTSRCSGKNQTRSMFLGFGEEWADSAAVVAAHSLTLDSSSAAAYKALSFSRFQQSRFHEAMSAGLRLLELEPHQPQVINNLGFIAAYRGDHVNAVRWAHEAIALDSTWAPPRTLVGLMLAELGEISTSLDWLSSAHAAQPGWPPNAAFVVWANLLSRDLEEAHQSARALLEQGQRSPVDLTVAADVAVARKAPERALSFLTEIHGRAPDYMPPYGISNRARLGLVLHSLGRDQEASPLLKKAEELARREIEDGNESKNYRLELACIEAARGDLSSALTWLEDAYRHGWRDPYLNAIRPGLEQLRGHPQMNQLLGRIHADLEVAVERLARLNLTVGPTG